MSLKEESLNGSIWFGVSSSATLCFDPTQFVLRTEEEECHNVTRAKPGVPFVVILIRGCLAPIPACICCLISCAVTFTPSQCQDSKGQQDLVPPRAQDALISASGLWKLMERVQRYRGIHVIDKRQRNCIQIA